MKQLDLARGEVVSCRDHLGPNLFPGPAVDLLPEVENHPFLAESLRGRRIFIGVTDRDDGHRTDVIRQVQYLSHILFVERTDPYGSEPEGICREHKVLYAGGDILQAIERTASLSVVIGDFKVCTADNDKGGILDEILMVCGPCDPLLGLVPKNEVEPPGLQIPRARRLEEAIFKRR